MDMTVVFIGSWITYPSLDSCHNWYQLATLLRFCCDRTPIVVIGFHELEQFRTRSIVVSHTTLFFGQAGGAFSSRNKNLKLLFLKLKRAHPNLTNSHIFTQIVQHVKLVAEAEQLQTRSHACNLPKALAAALK